MSTYRVRASAWSSLFDCAYRFEGIHLLGMYNRVGLRAALGTAIHAGTAAYDQAHIDRSGLTIDDASGVLIDKLHDPENDFNPDADDLTMPDAERIGIALLVKYCRQITPNYQFSAVEMETKPLDIDCGGGIVVQLTGTMDRARVCTKTDGIGIADVKSGGAAVAKGVAKVQGHGPQLGTYEILFEHTTGERITADAEIIGLKTNGTPEIGTGVVRNAKAMMLGTDDQPGLIEFAARMFRSGDFYPNSRSLLCSPKYCPRHSTCHFHE